MRFVTLNLDLQEVAVLSGAVETSLAVCDCRKEDRGSQCDACATLEPIHEELTRLLTRPRLRVPSPVALAPDTGSGSAFAATARAQLRIVPPIAADM